MVGSSPRAWGIPLTWGKSPSEWTVHPHVRGEYGHLAMLRHSGWRFIPTCVGNTKPDRWGSYSIVRFIPTCVGNTVFHQCLHVDIPVHPHVRGEYLSTAEDI